jgi:hypothetical protein
MTTDATRALAVVAPSSVDIACSLDDAGIDVRTADWRALAGRLSSREAIDGGVRLAFDDIDLRALTDLAIRERECCAFLSFAIGIGTEGTTLEVTGPAAARDLIDAIV